MSIAIRQLLAVVSVSLAAAAPGPAVADANYPSKPIRLIVNDSAGGAATDAGARMIAQRLEKALGQPIVIDNRPGGTGIVATDAVAKAEPDGYTLLFTLSDPVVLNPLMYKKLPYDAQKDLKVVAHIQKRTTTLMVNASLPPKTLAEVIAYAKDKPGTLSFASWGMGSQGHLAGEYLNRQAGVDFVHVPYKSAASWVTDMVAGRVTLAWGSPSLAKSLSDGGKVRVLAITGTTRSPLLPNVPTFAEAGYPNLGLLVSWQSLYAPANTPAPILEKLNAEIGRIMSTPEAIGSVVNTFGGEPVKHDLVAAGQIIVDDRARWQKTLATLGDIPLN